MRFVTYETRPGLERFGFLTSRGQVADLEGSFAGKLSAEIPREKACDLAATLTPPEVLSFLDGGDVCMEAARQASSFVEGKISEGKIPVGPSGENILFEPANVSLKAPLPRPRKMVCAGKNFIDHLKEMSSGGKNGPRIPVDRKSVV
jgi:hypothetical protein